jgi:ubiquinone biosynthesis protein UbiJ
MDPSDTASATATRALDALAGLVEHALDRLLQLDAGSDALLGQLDGRQLRVALRGAERGVRLRIANGRVRPVPDDGSEVDLGIAMEPAALVAWLGRSGTARGLPAGVRIEGDLDLARLLERAMAGFDPDWERPFVDLFGPVAGPQLARGLGGAVAWAREQAQALAGSAADFGVHEAGLVSSRTELEEFNAEVDRLRDDVERLAARLARITAGAVGA